MSETSDLITAPLIAFGALTQIATLDCEYRAKTITAERFAERVCQIMDGFYKDAGAETAKLKGVAP